MEQKLFSQIRQMNGINDANYILDVVLDSIDQICTHIPPNPLFIPSVTNSTISSNISLPNSCSSSSGAMNSEFKRFTPTTNQNSYNSLKECAFISKDCTSRLAKYIIAENWGKESILLYKYLDYYFRCQSFEHQIIEFSDKYLVFHTGLQRQSDLEYMYALLVRNKVRKTHKNKQKWRVAYGKICDSFLSRNELFFKLQKEFEISPLQLPQKSHIRNMSYDPRKGIEVSWEERLLTNEDRICSVIGNAAFFDSKRKFLKLTQLIAAFKKALQSTQNMALFDRSVAVPQCFVDTRKCQSRIEILLPLNVVFHNKCHRFALAIAQSQMRDTYIVKSVLTLKMAYNNARLVGYVHSQWLRNGKY